MLEERNPQECLQKTIWNYKGISDKYCILQGEGSISGMY